MGMVARTVIMRVIMRGMSLLLRWHVIMCCSALSVLHYKGATWTPRPKILFPQPFLDLFGGVLGVIIL